MASELVVTPGGYRQRDMVYKIGPDLRLRILTGRMQGVDASDTAVADYGSVPRDGSNPALTPGYALPPGADTPEGTERATLGRGWISFAHWTNEGSELVSSFRSTWTVPPEPATRSGQTIFLFLAMQDTIPMTLLPALQWGPSAAGGGEYWSVASWYIGGTTGAVFHGESVRVNAGDELTGVIRLTGRQRVHCDYRCGFEGLAEADLPVFHVRDLSRCGVVLSAYGAAQCSDYPDEDAMGFRNIDLMTGFRRPPLAWQPVSTITDCGQHVVVLSDANPGGEVDLHFRAAELVAEPEPVAAEATPEPEPIMAVAAEAPEEMEPAEVETAPEADLASGAEAAPEIEAVAESDVAAAAEAAPEPEVAPEPEAPEELPEEPEFVAAALEGFPEPEPTPEEEYPEEEEAKSFVADEIALIIVSEPEPEAAPEEAEPLPLFLESESPQAPEPVSTLAAAEGATAPEPAPAPEPVTAEADSATSRVLINERLGPPATLKVNPRIERLVEITIHNNSPASSGTGALEARIASLEATLAAFANLIASAGQTQASASTDGDISARLERLARLRASGALTDEEFAAVKAQVLGGTASSNGTATSPSTVVQ